MLMLVLIAFESARGVATEEQERKVEEIVELAASTIEELWIAPHRGRGADPRVRLGGR